MSVGPPGRANLVSSVPRALDGLAVRRLEHSDPDRGERAGKRWPGRLAHKSNDDRPPRARSRGFATPGRRIADSSVGRRDTATGRSITMMLPTSHSGRLMAGYVVGKVIGVGGKSVVYEATHIASGRRVALKVAAAATVLRDIHREAGSIAALDHPHVVRVYESGATKGLRFLAMELIDGGTLQDRLHLADLTVERAMRILTEIASALDAAHLAGFVHRDVKPSNILIDRSGISYLADFGLAQSRDDAVLADVFVGTAAYAAPEQFRGDPVTSACDTYALAAILYECLTGHPPFEQPTLAETVFATLTESPPLIPTKDGLGGQALDEVLRQGLAKRPDDRFQTAPDLMDAARNALRAVAPEILHQRAGRGPAAAVVDHRSPTSVDIASSRATE